MNLAMQLYSARNFTPWKSVFNTLETCGYQQVEGYSALYENPVETAQNMQACGLTMPTGHFGLDDLEADLDGALATARSLGIETIFCPWLAPELRTKNHQDWQALGLRLRRLHKDIAAEGLGFGWHNHDFEFAPCTDGSLPMHILLTEAPDILWQADIAWIARAGQAPATWISQYGGRIAAVHIKDIAAKGMGLAEDGWADVGQGILDWRALLGQVQQETKARYFVIEHDNPSDFGRFAAQSYNFVQSI